MPDLGHKTHNGRAEGIVRRQMAVNLEVASLKRSILGTSHEQNHVLQRRRFIDHANILLLILQITKPESTRTACILASSFATLG